MGPDNPARSWLEGALGGVQASTAATSAAVINRH